LIAGKMLDTRLAGARTHNLQGVDLELRPGEVVVLTGVSGAGKSSLALDTLYTEGQRRFVESFSPYARQFLERLERPPMDSLEPVPAAVAVDRKAPVKSSRSTVATMADLEPYLCGLFAKQSRPQCPEHAAAAITTTLEGATDRVLAECAGERLVLTYPVLVRSKEEYLDLRTALLAEGYRRVWLGGEVRDLDTVKPSEIVSKRGPGEVEVVIDRVAVAAEARQRIADGLETAFRRAGLARCHGSQTLSLREGLSCPECARRLEPPKAGLFSHESPLGACGNCRGFGRVLGVDLDKVIPDPRLSLEKGAVRPWRGASTTWERSALRKFCRANGIDPHTPWNRLTAPEQRAVIEGKGGPGSGDYPGVLGWFQWLETKTYKMHVRVLLSRYRSYDPCPVCRGSRLNEQALSYRVGGRDLAAWHALEVSEAVRALGEVEPEDPHGALLLRELISRLTYLERVGLGYLSLDRQARTLSGGEAQRVTLTAALGTSLHNALFVLDEPTVGLHPSDVVSLTGLIRELAERDNVVVVIEHDPAVIAAADRVVELGPGAGPLGGRIVFDGSVEAARRHGGATARALEGTAPAEHAEAPALARLVIVGAREHNLQNVDVHVPLGQLVAVSGPSGSGKSTLVVDVLARAVARALGNFEGEKEGRHERLEGAESLRKLELVDQAPLGRTSRGNPATYTKAWDTIRKLFAAEPEAVARQLDGSSFSFNVEGGRCDACAGEGFETVEMQFLADVALPCPVCQGRRFKDVVLGVRHRGRTIADVLELSIDEALALWADQRALFRCLAPLRQLGLGYLKLGQPLSTLSGGEAQRLKLARALQEAGSGTLYVLDEPSAGLHADEVQLLLAALRALVRAGSSVVVVDHDLQVLAAADHLIELGPGGGSRGGRIVAEGTPAKVAAAGTATGQALRELAAAPGRGREAAKERARGKRRATGTPAALTVQHAREHNLKDVSVSVPHGKLTIVTGPSGSGKSTLAFDVVFAEGQRRFLETLTPYARQFLPTMARPDVDAVVGVPPAIALEQRTTRAGARSTVATVTEVAHYLRLAYAKLGTVHCPDHGTPIARRSAEELRAEVRAARGPVTLLAPAVRARKGTYLDVFNAAQRAGILLAVCDGVRVTTDAPPKLAKTKEHDIDLVLAEAVAPEALDDALFDKALSWGKGTVKVAGPKGAPRELSLTGSCSTCGFSSGELDPRYFSFNTRQGQCEVCEGYGWVERTRKVPRRAQKKEAPSGRGATKAAAAEPEYELIEELCTACDGSRLAPLPRSVRLQGRTYPELAALSVARALAAVEAWKFSERDRPIAEPILAELRRRLRFLTELGLDYLSLDRDAASLSGGEMQRLHLAAQLGAGLTGALYVLDEPTIGLHPRDTGRLLGNLRRLVDTGSTVLVVEHDEETIRAADHLIDLGPAGGSEGGQVMAEGTPAVVLRNAASPTGRALSAPPELRTQRPPRPDTEWLTLHGARENNLVGDAVRLPLQRLTVVAGVSGSGKSTLVRSVLLPALRQKLERVTEEPGEHDRLEGWERLGRAVAVDQSPIGRTPRSVPVTFLGVWDLIRKLFAASTDAQVQGFTAARFSFNTAQGGRCPACEGQGVISHEMSFLPDVVTPCPTCEGMRFEPRTLSVRYLGLNIGQVLGLTAAQAVKVFEHHPKIRAPLETLCELGAGYITLGQGSHTLSGGEAQRLKLAAELTAGTRHLPTLYVLDEPTTGLHVADVAKLIRVLDRLVERGDTLVVIEHHPEVIAGADYIVELGPEGGERGGRLVAEGTPRELLRRKTATAEVVRRVVSAARQAAE
jgi:excinuclease ABC subunit A